MRKLNIYSSENGMQEKNTALRQAYILKMW
jgi:hypothetical protein